MWSMVNGAPPRTHTHTHPTNGVFVGPTNIVRSGAISRQLHLQGNSQVLYHYKYLVVVIMIIINCHFGNAMKCIDGHSSSRKSTPFEIV